MMEQGLQSAKFPATTLLGATIAITAVFAMLRNTMLAAINRFRVVFGYLDIIRLSFDVRYTCDYCACPRFGNELVYRFL